MTVQDLIERLEKCDRQAEVRIAPADGENIYFVDGIERLAIVIFGEDGRTVVWGPGAVPVSTATREGGGER